MAGAARHIVRWCALSLMVSAASSAQANAELSEGINLNAPVLTDQVLATQRGGFWIDNLEIAIGLEQTVAVNGETRVVNRLTIPNLNQTAIPSQLQSHFESVKSLASDLNLGTVIKSGSLNNNGWLTTIQNSIDGVVIQNMRQLNVEINNLNGNQRLPQYFDTQYLQSLGR